MKEILLLIGASREPVQLFTSPALLPVRCVTPITSSAGRRWLTVSNSGLGRVSPKTASPALAGQHSAAAALRLSSARGRGAAAAVAPKRLRSMPLALQPNLELMGSLNFLKLRELFVESRTSIGVALCVRVCACACLWMLICAQRAHARFVRPLDRI